MEACLSPDLPCSWTTGTEGKIIKELWPLTNPKHLTQPSLPAAEQTLPLWLHVAKRSGQNHSSAFANFLGNLQTPLWALRQSPLPFSFSCSLQSDPMSMESPGPLVCISLWEFTSLLFVFNHFWVENIPFHFCIASNIYYCGVETP